jgi:uncharacterized protein (TIGR03437 family)
VSRAVWNASLVVLAALLCREASQAAPVLAFNPTSVSLTASAGGATVTSKLALQNTGNLATSWSIALDTSAPWLTVSAVSGQSLAAGGFFNLMLTANPTVTKPGTYKATIIAQGNATVAALAVTLTVSGVSVTVTPNPIVVSVLAGAQQSFPAVAQIAGTAPISISVASGTWLTADTSVSAPASFSILVNARALKASATPYQGTLLIQCGAGTACAQQTVTVSVTVSSKLTLSCNPTSGPAQVGQTYTTTCTAAGGASPYNWSTASSTVPSGLSLSSSSGASIKISGMPKTSGSYSYAIQVADSTTPPQTAQQSFSGSISAGIAITPSPIVVATLAGSQQPFPKAAQIDGTGNATITVSSGTWLTADTSVQAPGSFSININAKSLKASVTSYQGALLVQCTGCISQTVPVSLTVYSQLAVTCSPVAGPTRAGVAFSSTCTTSGGLAPFSWAVSSGSLPGGLSLSATTGSSVKISGTPTTGGVVSFTVQVADSSVTAQTATQSFTSTIASNPSTLTASPVNLSFGSYSADAALPASQTIALSSSPASGLAFTSSLGSDCAWLKVSPATGSTPATVNASVDTTGVASGFHSCTITFNATSIVATLSIGSANTPAVSAVVSDATFTKGSPIAPGSWVAVFGTNLAPDGDSRTWLPTTEIVNGVLPTSLDGTSVTVNGKPAVVAFLSPSQVNIQPPDDAAAGPVQVVVSTKVAGPSASFSVTYASIAPGFFAATAPYLVAQHADNSLVGGYAGATPAAPGETIVLWGTGFGPATPVVAAGKVFSGANNLSNKVSITIGGQPATVLFAGVVAAGLVQINVQVPTSIANGDAAVVATIGGVSTQTAANMISIQN